MKSTWIIAAHRAGARIFEKQGPDELALVSEIEHPEGRLKTGELVTDRPGMAFRAEGRHPMASKHPAHEQVAEAFAAQLAELLRSARNQNRLGSLVLVAEPHFLGILRKALDEHTAALVSDVISKDLSGSTLAQARAALLSAC